MCIRDSHCDIVVVEGCGGLMSPLDDETYFADVAFDHDSWLWLPAAILFKREYDPETQERKRVVYLRYIAIFR